VFYFLKGKISILKIYRDYIANVLVYRPVDGYILEQKLVAKQPSHVACVQIEYKSVFVNIGELNHPVVCGSHTHTHTHIQQRQKDVRELDLFYKVRV
jgi:hypothetical protein